MLEQNGEAALPQLDSVADVDKGWYCILMDGLESLDLLDL